MRSALIASLEDIFLAWKLELKAGQQEYVEYDHYDDDLRILFLRRTETFNRLLVGKLQDRISEEIDPGIRVSTIVVSELL